jgi:hypothetical protein
MLEFDFHADIEKLLSARVVGMTLKMSKDAPPIQLPLPSDFVTRIDSSRPYLYLPANACTVLSKKLKLVNDPVTDHLFVSPDMHSDFLEQNPAIEFQFASLKNDSQTMKITLSYSSLALRLGFPHISPPGTTHLYFPMRCTDDTHKYVLGRAFLQSVYLIANYERQKFSMSQVDWNKLSAETAQSIAILPDKSITPGYILAPIGEKAKLPTAALVGIVSGSAILIGLAIALFWCRKRRVKRAKVFDESESSIMTTPELQSNMISTRHAHAVEIDDKVPQVIELHGTVHYIELDTSRRAELADTSTSIICTTSSNNDWASSAPNGSDQSKTLVGDTELQRIDTTQHSRDLPPASPIPQTPHEYYGYHAPARP